MARRRPVRTPRNPNPHNGAADRRSEDRPIPLTIVRVAVGLALGAFGILVELGLDEVVGVAPWLIVTFFAGLLAAFLGGVSGGVIAAAIGLLGQVAVIPAWMPAAAGLEGSSWPVDVAIAVTGCASGLLVRRLVLDAAFAAPIDDDGPWHDGLDRETGLPWGAAPGHAAVRASPDATRTAAPPPATKQPALALPSADDLAVVTVAIRDFGAARTPIQVADALARHAATLCRAPLATVYLARPTGERAELVPVGRAGGIDPTAPSILPTDRLASEDPNRPPEPASDPDALEVPLAAVAAGRPKPVGAIRLRRPGGPAPRPSALLGVVGQLAVDALERVRLDAARRSADDEAVGTARRLALLGGLALELVGGTSVDEVGTTLLGFAVDDLGAGYAAVHVLDEGSTTFRLVDARGLPAGLVAAQASIAEDAPSPVTQAAATGEPVEIVGEDGWRGAYPRTSNMPAITGVRAISAIPMTAGGMVRGVLTIGWRATGDRSSADRSLLAAVAAQGAQALERAILHAHDEDARRFQEAFIGVVSHELRTPITTILAGSRLLRRRLAEDEGAAELSGDIEVEAERLSRIVDDLLVLSRLERRHLTVGDDPVHLDHLLVRVVRSEAARWPDHTFDIPSSPSRHVVLGEETYVEQVLRNLISNAAKYSPAGTAIRITIDDAPDGEVEVRVLDQGPGIAPGEVDELFSLFYRSPSTAAAAAGAGIGLFVSRRLVSEMGGRVWARPRPGGGSEFGFSLGSYPIDEVEPGDEPLPTRPSEARASHDR